MVLMRSALGWAEEELFEKLWRSQAYALWLANFHDIFRIVKPMIWCPIFEKKIKEQIDDPVLAEKLCPTDHGFGLRRVPMEVGIIKCTLRQCDFG